MGEKAEFTAAVEGGYTKDALTNIQRRFFKRFPLNLPDDVEPSPEHLAAVDDDKPDEELEEPDEQVMTVEQYNDALKNLEDRQALLLFRKGVSIDVQPDMAMSMFAQQRMLRINCLANQTLVDLPIHEGQQLRPRGRRA